MSSPSYSMMHTNRLITPHFILLQSSINQVLKISVGVLKIVSRPSNQEKPNQHQQLLNREFYGYIFNALEQQQQHFTCSTCCSWMLITPDYEVLLKKFVDPEITWPRFCISFCSFQKFRFKKQIYVCDTLMICNLHKEWDTHRQLSTLHFLIRKFYCAIPHFILHPCAENSLSSMYSRVVRLNLKWKSECISISPPPVYFVYRDVMVYSNIAFYLLTHTKNISAQLRKSGQFACLDFWK